MIPKKDILDWANVVEALAKAEGTWILYLSTTGNPDAEVSDILKAAPFGQDVAFNLLGGGFCVLRFHDEAAGMAAFGLVVGDDGPTKTNPYNGRARVFAYLAGPEGGITENT